MSGDLGPHAGAPQVDTALGLRPHAVSTCGYSLVHYTPDCPAWGVLTNWNLY